jgi:DNA-binding HxlR family transcriptional regulator
MPAADLTPAPAVAVCPVEQAIRIVGGKWKLLVVRALLLNGPRRYNELLAAITGISPKELTRNLRELAADGIVARDPSGAPRTAPWSVTKRGQGLMPAFKRLLVWGRTLNPSD